MPSPPDPRTVAIWGSCVTRDAFDLKDRAEEVERLLPLVYYGARSSWISQDSRPWRGPAPRLEVMTSGFGRRMVTEDLDSTLVARLVEHRPALVVIDLVDERLPLARVGSCWVTVSDYLRQTDLADQVLTEADEISAMTGRRRPRLFAGAARRVARRLMRELPDTTFVLNEAPYTTRIGDGTSLAEPRGGWARDLDAAQQPLIAALAAAFGPRLVRATPPPEVCVADPEHRWGVASYHYVPAYYHWLIDTLLAIEPAEPGRAHRPPRAARPTGPLGLGRLLGARRAVRVDPEGRSVA